MGEPAGIGGELSLKLWLQAASAASPFFVIDDPARLERLAKDLALPAPVASIASPEACTKVFGRALPVLPVPLSQTVTPGRPDPACAPAVLESIEMAAGLALEGRAAAIVTNPIQKAPLYEAGFEHPGHTEFLAHLAGMSEPPVMMLASPALRVVPVTIHIPLAEVARTISAEAIVHCGQATAAALVRDFGVDRPRIAVAALNPHAGEAGALGREETDVIMPAIKTLKKKGISVTGPTPADTLFHAGAREGYDAVLCMYHDQALIPLKTIDIEAGVNVTLGLPFIRTSPDHGTALDIAGKGTASPASLQAALQMANDMAIQRAARPVGADAGRARQTRH